MNEAKHEQIIRPDKESVIFFEPGTHIYSCVSIRLGKSARTCTVTRTYCAVAVTVFWFSNQSSMILK